MTRHPLETVAKGFGERLDQVVFIGGATLDLYATDPGAPQHRPTEDVDCLVNVSGRAFLYEWDQWLQQAGFVKYTPHEVPAFYWLYDHTKVHLLPPDPDMVGFENRWFEEGLFHAVPHTLDSGCRIRLFSAVYFLATKLEALTHRGWHDLRHSEDLEDVVFLIDNRPELSQELHLAFYEVRGYIQDRLRALLAHQDLEEGLYHMLPVGTPATHLHRLINLLRSLAGMQDTRMAS